MHNLDNVYSTFNGVERSINPLPTKDQPINQFDEKNFGRLEAVDINRLYNESYAV